MSTLRHLISLSDISFRTPPSGTESPSPLCYLQIVSIEAMSPETSGSGWEDNSKYFKGSFRKKRPLRRSSDLLQNNRRWNNRRWNMEQQEMEQQEMEHGTAGDGTWNNRRWNMEQQEMEHA
ncbi:hypothetical protein BgiMline_002594 [Biomphalaria glabrata]|nr:hypothetical protein BgiMline_011202 [Biomphalaria glabrata]